jgi:hypothetical protein
MGPEGIHLIFCQVRNTTEPGQALLGFQLREMRQGGNQPRSSPLADSISDCGVDLALEQLHHNRQRCYQRRGPVDAVQLRVPNLRSQSLQGLQLSVYLHRAAGSNPRRPTASSRRLTHQA